MYNDVITCSSTNCPPLSPTSLSVTGINVPRTRFLPVKKTSDLLVVMSNLFTMAYGTLKMNPARTYPSLPVVKLGDQHFMKVQRFSSWLSTGEDKSVGNGSQVLNSVDCQNQRLIHVVYTVSTSFAYCTGQPTCKPVLTASASENTFYFSHWYMYLSLTPSPPFRSCPRFGSS